ncbi:CMP-N,N'-diacetyllegionaminic acid synthase [compost metagenome]
MAEKRKVIVIIPGRGGSKRLPKKNTLVLGGKPLIQWSIDVALKFKSSERVVVSSDDEEILNIAVQHSAFPMIRDSTLASDTARTFDVVMDCLTRLEHQGEYYDDVVLLQPTSPMRSIQDLEDSYALYKKNRYQTVVSVCEIDHPIQWTGHVVGDGQLTGVDFSTAVRSQDIRKSYRVNGAVYIFSTDQLRKNKTFYTQNVFAHIMPRERSVDIDTRLDFEICAALLGSV